jgi:hypothetical protein
MASTKPLVKKLMIRENYKILIVNEPTGYKDSLIDLPEGSSILKKPTEKIEFIQLFAKDRAELETHLKGLTSKLDSKGWLWISYPKGSSKIKTDINRDSIWMIAKDAGLKAVHQIAIDETWSAIRFRFED